MSVHARIVDAVVVPVGMQNLDRLRVVQVLDQGHWNASSKFVLLHDGSVNLIDPEHVGFENVHA